MSQVKVSGNASGTGVFEIAAPNTNTNYTLTLPEATTTLVGTNATQTLTNKTIQGGAITSGTAVASTSGTSIDFTSIPSWVKRITVMLSQVSTNGSSIVQLQVGSGSFSTTGYQSTASFGAGATNQYAYATTGFIIDSSYANAALTRTGTYVFTLLGSNTWVGVGNIGGNTPASITYACAGNSPALGGTLDRVRITTVNGTDAFDAGSINILYE